MGYFRHIYRYYLKWRPAYYHKMWKTYQYLNNYKDCINEKKKGKDKFKNAEKKLLKLLSTKNC